MRAWTILNEEEGKPWQWVLKVLLLLGGIGKRNPACLCYVFIAKSIFLLLFLLWSMFQGYIFASVLLFLSEGKGLSQGPQLERAEMRSYTRVLWQQGLPWAPRDLLSAPNLREQRWGATQGSFDSKVCLGLPKTSWGVCVPFSCGLLEEMRLQNGQFSWWVFSPSFLNFKFYFIEFGVEWSM